MNSTLRAAIVASLLLASAFADIPAPPPHGQRMHMRIVKDSLGAGGAVLQIPSRLLPKHAALLDIRALPLGRRSDTINLVVAGCLLSASMFFLGRWFWRRREKADAAKANGKTVQVLLVAGMLLGGAILIRNATAADDPGNLNSAVAEGQTLEGTVAVQVRDDINEVVLHLTPPRRPIWHPQNR